MNQTWAESVAEHERKKAELSADIQAHRFENGTLVFIGKAMADELSEAILLRRYMREHAEPPKPPTESPFFTVAYAVESVP